MAMYRMYYLSPAFQSTRSWRFLPKVFFLRSFQTESRPTAALNWPNIDEWNSVLIQSKQLFESVWKPPKPEQFSNKTFYSVIKRLQTHHIENEHLIRIFSNLSENISLSTAHWPGLVSIMFSKAAEEAMTSRNRLNNRIGRQQLALAEIINLLYSCLLFRTEYFKFVDSKNGAICDKNAFRLINNYFLSEALYKLRIIENNNVVWFTAVIIEFLVKSSSTSRANPFCHRTVASWENNVLSPQGIIVANGCKAAMELADLSSGLKELGFQYGRFLTLAAKAHIDIQQFLDYHRSYSSYFALNSLPVVLHLQRNPETLAYIYSCGKPINNLDFHMVHSAVLSGSAMEEANQRLKEYTQTALTIAKEFERSQLARNLIKLTKTLNKFEF